MFYNVKVTVVSPQGKEGVVSILGAGDFFGEACLAGQLTCTTTTTTLDASAIVRIDRATMNRVIRNEPAFSELFLAHVGKAGQPAQVIPQISQETLAEMIGTTRFRVSFFMYRFKNLGCITYDKYDSSLRVDRSLLSLVIAS